MNHASLFSGIGGPEVAAAMLGWRNIFHCEINPFGRKVLEYWFPESDSYGDITKTDFTKYRGQIDVLTGGFPCQPFSYAGKRGGREDERYLWPEMLRTIAQVRPTWVVGENVAGITTMVEGGVLAHLGCEAALFDEEDTVHGYCLSERFTIERICQDFEQIGYAVQPVLVPAAAVGAPHRRDRVFFLAHNDAQNTERNGCGFGEYEEQGRERNIRHACAGDTERLRGKANQAEAGARLDTERPCYDGASAYTFCKRLATALQSGGYDTQERNDEGRPIGLYSHDAWLEGAWWDSFPTQSPVHRGNDGIPFGLDDLTLPAEMQPKSYRKSDPTKFSIGKWRIESLKAYGNAIVPQVMYRIFQAIEQANNQQ